MQRYNGFNLIHKALRAMLYDTASALQQTYFADFKEAEDALKKVEDVLFLFERHAYHEDTFILPAIEQFNPMLAEEFEKEHVEDVTLGNRLRNLLNVYRNLNFPEERMIAGSAISKSFVDFMVFNLEHMSKEEILINKVLWENYTDAQLIEMNQEMVVTLTEEEMKLSSLWMIRSISDFDAVNWLKTVKRNAPELVFKSLLTLAAQELPKRRFEIIEEGLSEKGIAA